MYAVLAQEWCSQKEGEEEGGREGRREVVKRVLEGMATMEGFRMRMRMMEEEDRANILKAFEFLEACDSAAAAAAATTAGAAAAAAGGGAAKKGGKKGKAGLVELRRKYLG